MQEKITLSIPTPCSEKWNTFMPTRMGGFCNRCNKTVIDFTKMTDDEIITYFKDNSLPVCGRFYPTQLKVYATAYNTVKPGFTVLKAALFSTLLFIVSKNSYGQMQGNDERNVTIQEPRKTQRANIVESQKYTVSGVVIDSDSNEGIPGTNILLKGTSYGTTTDAYGNFKFPKKLKEGDVLIFSFIGYEIKEYVVPKNGAARVELSLKLSLDVSIMGEVATNDIYHEDRSLPNVWSRIKSIFRW